MGREENKADKRSRIRDAAEALFLERGFDATTTQMVAERAGVAKGTVFLYAPTKTALVALVFEDRIPEVAEDAFATAPVDGSLLDELDHVFGRFFALYARNPALARLFLRELSFADPGSAERRRSVDHAFLARLAARIEARKASREVRADVPALLAAVNAFALYLLALTGWLAGIAPTADAARAQLRAQLDLAIRGIAGEGGGTSWQTRSEPSSTKERSRSATRGRSTSTRGASATEGTKRRGSS